jgi:hypothetical protein
MSGTNPRDLAALKTRFRGLINRVGGFEAASAALGHSVSRLSEAASIHHADRAPRVDHIAELEQIAGEPLVTACLAQLAGHTLVPIPSMSGEAGTALAAVLRGAGDVGARTALALADGKVDDAERGELLEGLQALANAVAQAQAVLAKRPTLRAVEAA